MKRSPELDVCVNCGKPMSKHGPMANCEARPDTARFMSPDTGLEDVSADTMLPHRIVFARFAVDDGPNVAGGRCTRCGQFFASFPVDVCHGASKW